MGHGAWGMGVQTTLSLIGDISYLRKKAYIQNLSESRFCN
jgi:hypothetical protein